MADQRFFKKCNKIKVSEILDLVECSIKDGTDTSFEIQDVRPLHTAEISHLSFFDNIKYKNDFKNTKAGACFVSPQMAEFAPENTICLVSKTPYKAYALITQKLYPEPTAKTSKIAPNAMIESSATIGMNVQIGSNAYIGEHVEIGNHVLIEPNAVIMDGVKIGNYCRIGCNTTISHAIIGDHVRFYPGVCIGQDGFGFAIDPAGHVKVPQLGRVIIEDHVEIGANTTIDRGSGPDTVIGQGTWIDNLVQIGHNVTIGKGCVIVAQVGISGSTRLENYVVIGGQAGIAGHVTIGTGARLGAQAGIISDIPAGKEYMGSPAFPKFQYLRQISALNNLIKKEKKV